LIKKALIVDDEKIIRNFLKNALQRENIDVQLAHNGKDALKILNSNSFDVVITDLKMPDISGLEILKYLKEQDQNCLVILITAHGSIENAIEAIQHGAFYYLVKPFSVDEIEAVLKKATDHIGLINENNYLKEEIISYSTSDNAVAVDPAMKQVIKKAKQIAKSNAGVFISGESGTGKEVIARLIHKNSKRKNAPFITVNCAAIPDTLIESEFFGHEKGAFTGALQRRIGRFERADSGTLFLDEITEIPISLQPKLLRAIQELEFERLGGNETLKVDVRFISTTNRNMDEAIQSKLFREDLYYRLNVIPLHIPALRYRKKDIIPLAEFFIQKYLIRHGGKNKSLTDQAKEKLLDYHFPGNVRELNNVIERAIVLSEEETINADLLFTEIDDNIEAKTTKTLKEVEKNHILKTLKKVANNKTKAAQVLGISLRTLRNKINDYAK
jgi:two-component system, NtrC family, response regulator AtoC